MTEDEAWAYVHGLDMLAYHCPELKASMLSNVASMWEDSNFEPMHSCDGDEEHDNFQLLQRILNGRSGRRGKDSDWMEQARMMAPILWPSAEHSSEELQNSKRQTRVLVEMCIAEERRQVRYELQEALWKREKRQLSAESAQSDRFL
jgi:hypothetical protein